MKFPSPLVNGSTIAITALSSGIEAQHIARYERVKNGLTQRGFKLIEGKCLHGQLKHASASKEERAAELMTFLLDDTIDAIAPPWGGELAMELLPLLDFSALATAKPKWLMGFSDITTISAVLTCKLGWASAHCSNLMDLDPAETDRLTAQTFEVLAIAVNTDSTKTKIVQQASQAHTRQWPKIEKDSAAILQPDTATKWQWLCNAPSDKKITGRLVGGCLNTLHLLAGTEYFDLKQLNATYPEGLLLYFENVELEPTTLIRVLLSLKFHGVFAHVNAVLLGRSYTVDSEDAAKLRYFDVISDFFSDLNLPVIYDMDFGHMPPNLTLINGAVATVQLDDTAQITQTLRPLVI